MKFSACEDIISITSLNPFGRFDDGRPKVPDELLERLKVVGLEEAWKVLQDHDYKYQFAGSWNNLHPDRVLIGRAITATMTPIRPDLHNVVMAQAKREGQLSPGWWVLNAIGENDVAVVDIKGTNFLGDCLATAVSSQGGTGLVIDGGLRDMQGIYDIPNFNVFCRGYDPTTGGPDRTLISLNGPTQIGQATVLPGDIVMGNREGILFIPPHLVEEAIETYEKIHIHEMFIKQRMRERKYPACQIYGVEWGDEIKTDFEQWCQQYQS